MNFRAQDRHCLVQLGAAANLHSSRCAATMAGPQPLQDQVKFEDLCQVFQALDETRAKKDKVTRLERFVVAWRHSAQSVDRDSFYPVMRLILPDMDKDRSAYGVKETQLGKDYVNVLGLDAKKSEDALKLLNYKTPSICGPTAGDFAGTAGVVMSSRLPEVGELTIREINQALDQLAHAHTLDKAAKARSRRAVLLRLCKTTTAFQHTWLIRIILKDLKIGVNESTMFQAFHPDASHLWSTCCNLAKVCKDLHDPSVRLDTIQIALFQPIKPMLAQRAEHGVDRLIKSLEENFYIENKYDGDRIQLHKSGNTYQYYSRSAKDYSHKFGTDPSNGTHCPHVHGIFNPKVKNCILDGEMIAWDPEKNDFVKKGENVDVKNVGSIHDNSGGKLIPCYMVFDVIYLNGESFCKRPLSERKGLLKSIFKETPGRMMITPYSRGRTKEDFLKAVNLSIDQQEEGIVIKVPNSMYKPDSRKDGWYKWKPEYVDQLSDDVDVLIVGGYFGEGKRGGKISHFMCAVAEPCDPPNQPSVFHSFCKVGSGYTYKELDARGRQFARFWRRFDKSKPPCGMSEKMRLVMPGFKEAPDVWIEPEDSMVVQIKAAEIAPSDKWSCGYTLRFPRLMKFRDDKRWDQVMTTDDLEVLRRAADGKLTTKHMTGSDLMGTRQGKRRKVEKKVTRGVQVVESQRATDVSKVKAKYDIFKGMEICVYSGNRIMNKSHLDIGIKEHGGTPVQGPGEDTSCVIAGRLDLRTKNCIKLGKWDVIDAAWLVACLTSHTVLELNPRWMLYTTESTEAQLAESVDPFGDSYTANTSVEALLDTFKHVEEKQLLARHCPRMLTEDQVKELEDNHFPNQSALGLFRRMRIYVDRYASVGDETTCIEESPLDIVGCRIEFYGGRLTHELTEASHVIVHSDDLTRLNELRHVAHAMMPMPHIVTHNWINKAIADQWLPDEADYRVLI